MDWGEAVGWMILPIKRYFHFGGRSRRKEYWMYFLFTIILGIIAGIIDVLLGFGSAATYAEPGRIGASATSSGPISGLVSLGLIIPSISVAFRRLHDTDRSAWWLLLIFIPILGWIALLVFYCQEGTRGPNRFGQDPKGANLTEVFG
ncbi:Uncharacterized membrane protein YhaH, DUF805 family [Sphingomonas gellani]|uniref:Uncharacterized membrane protein YhaH, DUF805 family n=1 Tax=Sphingomonas gellani TaxID=1166340 RepID=A0A1H7Y4X0_9SPHN|nr:DUF805 domain-containing protein [Sphingomonas gellani]SEM41202.1 Uncharacterized membrane protein YhaH, DUF805 family [Sphingomonas gellani]